MLFDKKSLLVIPVILLAMACNKVSPDKIDEPNPNPPADTVECQHTEAAIGLNSISGPTSISLGQTITLNVVTSGRNGCAISTSVWGTQNANIITLSASVTYQGCICTQNITELATTYSFHPTSAGIYSFQGADYDGNLIRHTVTVQ